MTDSQKPVDGRKKRSEAAKAKVSTQPSPRAKRPPRDQKREPRRLQSLQVGRWQIWQDRVSRGWRLVKMVPPAVHVVFGVLLLAMVLVSVNLVHWVMRKPTELLTPVSAAFTKTPAENWKTYGPLFRRYATAIVSPELLAALAQVESSANPAAHTYWRWNPAAGDVFGFYRPASSSVGMYQMTDAAYADAEGYCVRGHAVVEAGQADAPDACRDDASYFRVVPDHAIELTAIYLDRSVAAVLDRHHAKGATSQQKQDLATIIHLCGAMPAKAFIQHHFKLSPGQRCGDHDPAAYLAQVNMLEQTFRRLATD